MLRLPAICGTIERRILVNYRVDPEVMAANLPAPFQPKLAHGYAIGGICLIRLAGIRPRFAARVVPRAMGIRSENAAHRIAVRWDAEGGSGEREGVFIPRRDTDSWINGATGGRVFPGEHHRARFTVDERDRRYLVDLRSDDGEVQVRVAAEVAAELPRGSVFGSADEASSFFESGSLGYSATRDGGRFDGLELRCHEWRVQPLQVEEVASSYFEDESRFPAGSVEFDCALLMRDIRHEWHAQDALCCPAGEA